MPAGVDDSVITGIWDFPGSTPTTTGEGVNSMLNGCTAEVDVAAGSLCKEDSEPCWGAGFVVAAGEMALA